jgi:small-conductance mechanosensitive channel/CRP-like cAMP-binding protein
MRAVQTALLEHPEVLNLALVFALLALVLSLVVRKERRRLWRLSMAFAASLLLRVVEEGLTLASMTSSSQTIGFLALLLQGIAFVGLLEVVVFAVVLPLFRVAAPVILRELALACAYLALLLYLFSQYRVDVTGIIATSAVVTAVLGLALQDTLGNVIGGIALQMDGSIRPGDWIRLRTYEGVVRDIRWRHTALETRDGDTVLVPNSQMVKNEVVRLGRRVDDEEIRQRRWVMFEVDLTVPPARVLALVSETFAREGVPGVLARPSPDVVIHDIERGQGALRYAVRYWAADLWPVFITDSFVRQRIYYALKRAGIALSVPSQYLHLTPDSARQQEELHQQERERWTQSVANVELLRGLTDEERGELVAEAAFVPFAPGETILVQGGEVNHLYILLQGLVEVRVSVDGAAERAVTRISAPDTFGEMGMLTGEPRRASVVSISDVECLRVSKESFQKLVSRRPSILSDVSRVVAGRSVQLEAFRDNLSDEVRLRRVDAETRTLLGRIQRFLGI